MSKLGITQYGEASFSAFFLCFGTKKYEIHLKAHSVKESVAKVT
jgi:hypothetical protein